MRKIAFVTFACGEKKYFILSNKLISQSAKSGIFHNLVLTDNPEYYKDPGLITLKYKEQRFSYHDKIEAIRKAYLLGFSEMLYLDADLFISGESFFREISRINFKSGINYSRRGEPADMETYLSNKEEYKKKLLYLNQDFKTVSSIFEDVFYFNFNGIEKSVIENFFSVYDEIKNIKHLYDTESNYHRYGDQEGYTIALAAVKSGMPIMISGDLLESIKHLRASNHGYDGLMNTITSEIDFIFPYRKDSKEREENLFTVVNYYRKHFPKNRFIISEQGEEKSHIDLRCDHIFEKKSLPHNQSRCINLGIKASSKKVVCVVDSDIVLLNYYNIYQAARDIFLGECEYALPYTECADLPEFEYRRPWGRLCIGGIFVIDRELFVEHGMNDESFEGWGREDDARHEKLINSGVSFKRYDGHIVHLWHPPQAGKNRNAETNMSLLSKIRDGVDNTN